MTPGDEAGALREEEETPVDSAADAHDDPAPVEPDPGATKTRAEKKAEKAAAKAEKARLKAERAAAAARAPEAEEAPEQEAASAEDEAAAEAPAAETKSETTASEAVAEEEESLSSDGEAGVDEDETEDEAEVEARRPAGAWAASVAVLVVLLIAGLVTAGVYWNKASSASADSSGKQAAISTAETAVTDLFTIDYKNPNAWAANLKKLAAGQFLGVISNSSSAFAKIIPEGKVETTGKAQLAGVESYKGDTAQVAVLGYEVIKNSQNPQGSERPYHMVLSMVKSGSKWVVSNLEFVQ